LLKLGTTFMLLSKIVEMFSEKLTILCKFLLDKPA
jgi:hypothetical protein